MEADILDVYYFVINNSQSLHEAVHGHETTGHIHSL